jgi:hypothetical protein
MDTTQQLRAGQCWMLKNDRVVQILMDGEWLTRGGKRIPAYLVCWCRLVIRKEPSIFELIPEKSDVHTVYWESVMRRHLRAAIAVPVTFHSRSGCTFELRNKQFFIDQRPIKVVLAELESSTREPGRTR